MDHIERLGLKQEWLGDIGFQPYEHGGAIVSWWDASNRLSSLHLLFICCCMICHLQCSLLLLCIKFSSHSILEVLFDSAAVS